MAGVSSRQASDSAVAGSDLNPRRRARLKQRLEHLKSPHMRHMIGTFIVGGAMAVAMTVHIQQRWHLYGSSGTITMVNTVTACVLLVVLGLASKRWYVLAWAVTLIAPPVLFFFALRILERHPPVPPMG